MNIFIEYDLPCFQPKVVGKYKVWDRYFLVGNLGYVLSNVEDLNDGTIYFELHDEQGLIGEYLVTKKNWDRLVQVKKDLVES
jgi:hypothetical protein